MDFLSVKEWEICVKILQFSVCRIYGDKAVDMIEGLMKKPDIAVPLVLRRLRAKLDEWREAQKNYNRFWREQCDRNHAKWLQCQAATFRQVDGRQMRTKTLLNEADTAAEEVTTITISEEISLYYNTKRLCIAL